VQESFRDTRNETAGRVNYGPGKEPARDFQLKLAGGAGLSVWLMREGMPDSPIMPGNKRTMFACYGDV
jgi:hypothetical protein